MYFIKRQLDFQVGEVWKDPGREVSFELVSRKTLFYSSISLIRQIGQVYFEYRKPL